MMQNSPYILLVDDDDALLQALPQVLYLRVEGVKVDITDSPLEALKHVQKNEYDAIVSDIKMPGMDGLTLLTRIQEQRPEVPVLLITGHGEHDLAVQALRGGAYDFIQKPIDRHYFVAALLRAVQTHRLRRQVHEQQIALELYAKSLEDKVQERTRELIEANAAKDDFLSMASHELRTPLSSLKGMTQLLRRRLARVASPEVANLVYMDRAIRRMELLVQDLVGASLVETKMLVLQRHRCNIVELCRHTINEYIVGTQPPATITLEAPGEPIEAEVDEDRISQVLINLLSNAYKYSSRGSPITVTVSQAENRCVVAVQDEGEGIPAESLSHIFERFYRVPGNEVQTGSSVGLGLGLYISCKIVELHHGRLEVQSVPGSGSTFTLALPLFVKATTENDVTSA